MKKRIVPILAAVLITVSAVWPFGVSALTDNRIFDNAGLLTQSEAAKLEFRLLNIGGKTGTSVVIVTERGVASLSSYAERFYDNNMSGDGVILLYCPDKNEAYIDAVNRCRNVFGENEREALFDDLTPFIRSENYYGAFTCFADRCEVELLSYLAENGSLDDNSSVSLFTLLVISIIVGILIGFIAVFVMRSKLKTVRFNRDADNYTVNGSLNIAESRDLFLYRNIVRTAKPKPQNSSSGSGSSHSGSGRKF